MPGIKDILFVSMRPDLSSKKIRADQVAEALGAKSVLSGEINSANGCLIYVKHLESPEVMEKRKKSGFIQVYDPVDNYDMKYIELRSDFIDGFIASSVSHEIMLKARFKAPIQSIPHHHCNFKEKRIDIKRNGLVPGYIGDKTHYKGLKFVEKKLKNLFKDFHYNDLDRSYLSIDIGLAFRKDKQKEKLNSGLKLLNYMSYGIPSIVNFERGFSEIGNHGEHCLFVSDKKELLEYLDSMIGDYDMRKQVSENGFRKAKDYRIDRIADRYKKYLKKYFSVNEL